MISAISKWLSENSPFTFLCLLLMFISGYAVYHFLKIIGKVKSSEKTCEKIPQMEKDILIGVNLSKAIEDKIDTQTINVAALTQNINSLIAFLTTKHTDLQSGLFKSNSPIQLTEIGLDILDKCGGKKYINEHLDMLILEMEKQTFKSGLDIQNFATSIIIKEFNNDDFIHVRNYIYQNPIYKTEQGEEISVSAPVIYQVIGIMLRDKYFEIHPELKNKE